MYEMGVMLACSLPLPFADHHCWQSQPQHPLLRCVAQRCLLPGCMPSHATTPPTQLTLSPLITPIDLPTTTPKASPRWYTPVLLLGLGQLLLGAERLLRRHLGRLRVRVDEVVCEP